MVVAFFDGLCEPVNPGGWGCGGWYVQPTPAVPALARGVRGHAYYGVGQGMSNNVAEYQAALDALRAVHRAGWRGRVLLRGDSLLVINQARGDWACRAPYLVPLRDRLRVAMTHFEAVELAWVPRAQNAEADGLSRLAYRAVRERERNAPPFPQRAVRADTGDVAPAREERLHPIEILMRRGRAS